MFLQEGSLFLSLWLASEIIFYYINIALLPVTAMAVPIRAKPSWTEL